jgi:hypothetical protein
MAASAIEGKIADLLLTRLGSLPFSPAYRIAMPNGATFEPTHRETYLEARLLPNTTVNLYFADTDPDMFQGILQVTVVAPRGEGMVNASDIAGEIAADLKAAQIIGQGLTIKIEDRPSLAPMMQDGDQIRIPVSARYRVFA